MSWGLEFMFEIGIFVLMEMRRNFFLNIFFNISACFGYDYAQ